jgi:ABC-type Fe3+/spermidine/putrescine transport system ATPase subunit
MAYLELNGVEKIFGDNRVIKGIDLAIDQGEFVVFVGPSGCGKSTLLRLIVAQFASTAATSPTCLRANAILPWCSKVTRCTRT